MTAKPQSCFRQLTGYAAGVATVAREALVLAQGAVEMAERSATATMRAWLAGLKAQALSAVGDRKACLVTLRRAEIAVGHARREEDPAWMYEFDQACWLALAGACYRELSMIAAAERTLREALDALGQEATRRRAEVLINLARVRAQQRDADEAVGLAGEALRIAVESGSVASSSGTPSSTNRSPRQVIPFGWWPSPIGAGLVAARSTSYDAVHTTGERVAWLETRPDDGRTVVATWTPSQGVRDATPDGFDVGTSIHTYGGGAYGYTPTALVVVSADDQRLYRVDHDRATRAITPPGDERYGDLRPIAGAGVVCVRERRGGPDDLVVVPVDGSAPPRTLHEGHDFYAFPRPSPDARRLAWISWDHPNQPWCGTDLWVADVLGTGVNIHLGPARHVVGGHNESVTQPEWGPDGTLHFVSDRCGWWNLHRERNERVEPLLLMEAEFADAPWELDYSSYTFLTDGTIACRYRQYGLDHLGILDPVSGGLETLPLEFTSIKPYLRATGDRLAFIAASPTTSPTVVTLRLTDRRIEVLADSAPFLHPADISIPERIQTPASDGGTVHALYYPPINHAFTGPFGQRPPLIVRPHPGPTSDARIRLELRTQFFTSRGFAVVDVNYRGSTGYGRAYRVHLDGHWGVMDVQDSVDVVTFLADRGDVDPDRTVITGASAGGFTVLRALAITDRFAAGASWFGITDLATFRTHAPRFQRHHTDHLIGPWPEMADLYRERSPVHNADHITQPVLVINGPDDDVVSPPQAEAIVAALRQRAVPVTELVFPGEGHGLRRTDSIHRALEAELTFHRTALNRGS